MCKITEGCSNPIENSDIGSCASCGRALRKKEAEALKPKKPIKPIKPATTKLAKARLEYIKRKKVWIVDKMCAVYPKLVATQIHHKISREHNQYADDWARERGIPLLLDERHWLAVSAEGHKKIEEHPVWAKIRGFSIDRLSKK
jgi:hypothetical protein